MNAYEEMEKYVAEAQSQPLYRDTVYQLEAAALLAQVVQAQAAVRQAVALEKLADCVSGGGLYVYPKDKAD